MKRRHPHKSNILLVNITRLGDMLQATPTIAGMKMENPDCKVTVLVEKQFAEVCGDLPGIDRVVPMDLTYTVQNLAREGEGIIEAYDYVSKFVDELKGEKFDYCLNMSSSGYTALLLKLLNIGRNGGWTSDDEGNRIIESDWARLFATSVFHQNRQFNSLNLVDVFRCSADVEQHPQKLQIRVTEPSKAYARKLIAEAGFTNTGPLVTIQAGASQQKRQWLPHKFISLIRTLIEKHGLRVALIGTQKELSIIEPIAAGVKSPNCVVFAGKTSIPQLAAVIQESAVLVTGDTGPMHIAAAVGTPTVSMFLASAFGFETGPYSEGNLLLQPLIACGPCNPNKPCAQPDCHDQIEPELVAELTAMRVRGDVTSVPSNILDPRRAILYRTTFDQHGFYDLTPLTSTANDPYKRYRDAYRRVWMEDLGELSFSTSATTSNPQRSSAFGAGRGLPIVGADLDGLTEVSTAAVKGAREIDQLVKLVKNPFGAPKELSAVNTRISEIDRNIEQLGFFYPWMGPATRMFIFSKENIEGSDPLNLASQMKRVYSDLVRRCEKLSSHYAAL